MSVKSETEKKSPAPSRATKYFGVESPDPKGRVETIQLRFQLNKNLPDSLFDKSFRKRKNKQ